MRLHNSGSGLRVRGSTAIRLYGKTIGLGIGVFNSIRRLAVGGRVGEAAFPYSRFFVDPTLTRCYNCAPAFAGR
jgi:hypothetical protein